MPSRDAGRPELLRFLMTRLDEEQEVIIRNTPLFGLEAEPAFIERYVERRALLERNRSDTDVMTACVESMARVQGPPPVPVPDPADPTFETTVLGSRVLKVLAARFAWHHDYDAEWSPD